MKTLTPEERRIVSVAKVGSDHATDLLITIIERLTGEEIEPADTPATIGDMTSERKYP